jgi:putative ABC transport system substrate-binding protein
LAAATEQGIKINAPLIPGLLAPIGYLSNMNALNEYDKSFVQGLGELGYVEGKNLTIDYRFSGGKSERLAELAADLVREKVDLILTGGTPPTLAAMHATTTIPIVFGSMQGWMRFGAKTNFGPHPHPSTP